MSALSPFHSRVPQTALNYIIWAVETVFYTATDCQHLTTATVFTRSNRSKPSLHEINQDLENRNETVTAQRVNLIDILNL